jgi:hypothetical protein
VTDHEIEGQVYVMLGECEGCNADILRMEGVGGGPKDGMVLTAHLDDESVVGIAARLLCMADQRGLRRKLEDEIEALLDGGD